MNLMNDKLELIKDLLELGNKSKRYFKEGLKHFTNIKIALKAFERELNFPNRKIPKDMWDVLDFTEKAINQVEFSLKFGLEQAKEMEEIEAIGLFMEALINLNYLRTLLLLTMNAVAKYWEEV